MPQRQLGRVALVTGASKGIGRAAAIRLAAEGALVAVNYHADAEGARATVRAIEETGGRAMAVAADVSDQDQVAAMADGVGRELGSIDIVVNNAAIFPWREDWTAIDAQEWDRVLAVDLKGCFLVSRAAYPFMRARRWGRIISMSSATALSGQAELLHYASAKAAIVGFTRSLARAVGDGGITVNAVTTGRTLTEGFQRWFDDGTLSYADTVESRRGQAIKRLAVPADIVGTIAFLASDDAGYMTGQLLNVDGGRNMH
jgi:NAD(P)-dependent dehydrogenase (short-subunit alcohol dehydrogenase family)